MTSYSAPFAHPRHHVHGRLQMSAPADMESRSSPVASNSPSPLAAAGAALTPSYPSDLGDGTHFLPVSMSRETVVVRPQHTHGSLQQSHPPLSSAQQQLSLLHQQQQLQLHQLQQIEDALFTLRIQERQRQQQQHLPAPGSGRRVTFYEVVTVGYTYMAHEYDRSCITVDPLTYENIEEVMAMRRDFQRVTAELHHRRLIQESRQLQLQPPQILVSGSPPLPSIRSTRPLMPVLSASQQQQLLQLQMHQQSRLMEMSHRGSAMLASPISPVTPLSPALSELDDLASLTSRPSLDSSRASSDSSRPSSDSSRASIESVGSSQQAPNWRGYRRAAGDIWPRVTMLDQNYQDPAYQKQILSQYPNGIPVYIPPRHAQNAIPHQPMQLPPGAEFWDPKFANKMPSEVLRRANFQDQTFKESQLSLPQLQHLQQRPDYNQIQQHEQ